MPELAELEQFNKLAQTTVGRIISEVAVLDSRYLRDNLDAGTLEDILRNRRLDAVRRFGKMILLSVDEHELGLHFGMTGVLLVDGKPPSNVEAWGGVASKSSWDRFIVSFAEGGDLRVRDQRRFGSIALDPDLSRLGPDALAITADQLTAALIGGREPVKARLLDQSRIAGLGNLSVDEASWRAGVDPARAAGSLSRGEIRHLHTGIAATLRASSKRGTSRGGPLDAQRHDGGHCPKDGHLLSHTRIRGRGTWLCPLHQK